MARQSIADIRKNEILTTFYAIAKDEGLERTSFAMIAAKLEIQPSLIVHYFKNRDELISSLIQYNLDQYERIFIDELGNLDGDCQRRLLTIINRIFSKKWNDLFDDGVFYNCYSLSFRDPKVKIKFRELHNKIRQHIKALIQECKAADVLEVENESLLAQHISNLMDGAYYFASMIEDKDEQENFMKISKQGALQLLKWKSQVVNQVN